MQINSIQPNYYNSNNNTNFKARLFVTPEVKEYLNTITKNPQKTETLINKIKTFIKGLPDLSVLLSFNESSSRMFHRHQPQKATLQVSLGRTTHGDAFVTDTKPVDVKSVEPQKLPQIIYNIAKDLIETSTK